MSNRLVRVGGTSALVALCWLSSACSSIALPDGGGGSGGKAPPAGTGGKAATGTGGSLAGTGGMVVTGTGGAPSGTGGMVLGGAGGDYGSCIPNQSNPDTAPGGACAPDCQSVSCTSSMFRACTRDCCAPCGIDLWSTKLCTCPLPGGPFSNCTCPAPEFIPPGLHGGTCFPPGSSASPAQVANSLRGVRCREANLVCFTTDSTPSSERGCICRDDGLGNGGAGNGLFLHCSNVNHWFINDATTTSYLPVDAGS